MDYSNQVVSIIVPAFKRVDYLREAITSALGQTFENFELIVCDDSASPQIQHLCESFNDSRIIYRANPSRLGIAKNNLSGFLAAKSDLCASLHDDDRWTPHFLEKLVPIMLSNPQVCLAFSDHWLIDSDGNRMAKATDEATIRYRRNRLAEGKLSQPNLLLAWNSIPLAMASIFRKSAVDWSDYPEEIGGAYDLWLSYLLLRSGKDVYYVPERLTEYRVHGGSGSATRGLQNDLERLFVSEIILKDPLFQNIQENFRFIASSSCMYAATAYLRKGMLKEANQFYRQSIKLHWSVKSLIGLCITYGRRLWPSSSKGYF